MLAKAWKHIEILINAQINEMCNDGQYEQARETENARDIVRLALAMSGFETVIR